MSAKSTAAIKRLTEAKCNEWATNPMVNPITGKSLTSTAEGSIYDQIKKRCAEKYNIVEIGAPQPGQVVEAGPISQVSSSRSSSRHSAAPATSSNSDRYKGALERRRILKGTSLTPSEKWAAKRCANEDKYLITHEEMTEDDANNSFVIFLKNSSGAKWICKSDCLRRDDLYTFVNRDRNTYNNGNRQFKLPESILSNWVSKNPTDVIQENGMGGNAGYKLFVKIPTNNIYITLKSYFRIQKSLDVKEWYALPLFNGEKVRIGNQFGVFAQSCTHGQSPGSVIYKLFTKKEIADDISKIIEDVDEYNTTLIKINPKWWSSQLYSDDLEHNDQTNLSISKTIRSIVSVIPETTYKFMNLEQWGDPYRVDVRGGLAEKQLVTYYKRFYDIACEVLTTFLIGIRITIEHLILILTFIYYYYGKANPENVEIYTSNLELNAFVLLAYCVCINNTYILNLNTCRRVIQERLTTPFDVDGLYNKLKEHYTQSHFNEFKTLYQLIYESTNLLSKSAYATLTDTRIRDGTDIKLEVAIKNLIKLPEFYRLPPIYQARFIMVNILHKSESIFKVPLKEIDKTKIDKEYITADIVLAIECTYLPSLYEIPFW
jgi:hypothetical protein